MIFAAHMDIARAYGAFWNNNASDRILSRRRDNLKL
jgi:hypothetical protein